MYEILQRKTKSFLQIVINSKDLIFNKENLIVIIQKINTSSMKKPPKTLQFKSFSSLDEIVITDKLPPY